MPSTLEKLDGVMKLIRQNAPKIRVGQSGFQVFVWPMLSDILGDAAIDLHCTSPMTRASHLSILVRRSDLTVIEPLSPGRMTKREMRAERLFIVTEGMSVEEIERLRVTLDSMSIADRFRLLRTIRPEDGQVRLPTELGVMGKLDKF